MGWKEKEYRKTQKANRGGKETDSISPFDEEMLRIQGLIRCKECDMPYPLPQLISNTVFSLGLTK